MVSQLLSVARHARCFKLVSKPNWHNVNRIPYPKAKIPLDVSEGIFRIYLFTYTLIGCRNAQFTRRALHLHVCSSRQFASHVLDTWVGANVLNPETDCFVVLQLFCVVRHARCFKLVSKTNRRKVSRISYPKAIVPLHICEYIFYVYIYLHTH